MPDEQKLTEENKNPNRLLQSSIMVAALLIGGTLIFSGNVKIGQNQAVDHQQQGQGSIQEQVVPSKGVDLKVKWGDLGKKLVETGVIDKNKFEEIYNERGGLGDYERQLLYNDNNSYLIITNDNSGNVLNLLWALGLANKNPILETGPMTNPEYGGAHRFASTGGWTIGKGDAMDYYSQYDFIVLTPEQQMLVEEVSKNIYRPCCDNSTYFPDCNHGMAMLGLLELAASQGFNEEELYKLALVVNSYWFPDTYLTIANYFAENGVSWKNIDVKEVLGKNFSSGSGYRALLEKVKPVERNSGGSCGV